MNKEQLKAILKNKATFDISAEIDHLPIEGNCMASGDDDFDRECEQKIYEQLNAGNVWAWASVKVSARFNDFEGVDYLGACSYEDESDFLACGYYEDMKEQALDDLAQKILDTKLIIEELTK